MMMTMMMIICYMMRGCDNTEQIELLVLLHFYTIYIYFKNLGQFFIYGISNSLFFYILCKVVIRLLTHLVTFNGKGVSFKDYRNKIISHHKFLFQYVHNQFTAIFNVIVALINAFQGNCGSFDVLQCSAIIEINFIFLTAGILTPH